MFNWAVLSYNSVFNTTCPIAFDSSMVALTTSILKSINSNDLKDAIEESDLKQILTKKLAQKIEYINSQSKLFMSDIKPIIFENYKKGLERVEEYLKAKFKISEESNLDKNDQLGIFIDSTDDIIELDSFTKDIFEQKELTKLSIAVYKKWEIEY